MASSKDGGTKPPGNRFELYFEDSDTDQEEERNETSENPEPTSGVPREIKKEGVLFKQGGKNQDKGWNKRYMRFDGQSLRYYMNEKTAVSLRIIPVAIMEQARHDERRNSRPASGMLTSSRTFRFSLKTRNRTYLFGTDNHDNCVQWVCFLEAAILNWGKYSTMDGLRSGGSMHNPDHEGSIKFAKKSRKYYAALKGDVFRYYYNTEDYEIDCPVHELIMTLSSVKALDDTKLQLRSAPQQLFVLQFDSPTEADQWRMYLEEAISTIGDVEIVNHIRENKHNTTCADCSSQKTHWASINLGVVLCIRCAGIHRGLGVNYSKVRSLRMDNIFRQNDNLLLLFAVIGNENANKFWYAKPPPDRVIDEQTPSCIREKHIKQKYVTMEFVDETERQTTHINEDFLAAVEKGRVLEVMRLYELGADMNCKNSDGLDAVDIATRDGNQVLLEYILQNKSRLKPRGPRELSGKDAQSSNQKAIHHDGYLEKTGPNMKGFLKRWFVLHYGRLTYFDDRKGTGNPKEKGGIDLDNVVCVAVSNCNDRQFCFDLTCKANKRIYRFAAMDRDDRRKWMDVILQILCPDGVLDCPMQIKQYKIAGHFYIQQHSQGSWCKSWFGIGHAFIDIYYMNKSEQFESIEIDPGTLRIYKYNSSRSSKMLLDSPTPMQLDDKKGVELQIQDRIIRVQGHHADDTEKVFAILNPMLNV